MSESDSLYCLVRFVINDKLGDLSQIKLLNKFEHADVVQIISENETPYDFEPLFIRRADGRMRKVNKRDISVTIISKDQSVCYKYNELQSHLKHRYDYDIYTTLFDLGSSQKVIKSLMSRL